MSSRRAEDVGHYIELLGSVWASQTPVISDYACNKYAVELAELDNLITQLKKIGTEETKEAINELLELRRE